MSVIINGVAVPDWLQAVLVVAGLLSLFSLGVLTGRAVV